MTPEPERLQPALATLDRNRALIRARFATQEPTPMGAEARRFPRSNTLRWVMGAMGNKWLVTAASQLVLRKHPIGRVLAAWVLGLRD